MLDPKLKADWVAALRSGKYPQWKGHLQQKGIGFCCLGVLADVQGADWSDGTGEGRMVPTLQGELISAGSNSGSLSRAFCDRIKLHPDVASQLMSMNDGGVFSFDSDRRLHRGNL